MIERWAKPVRLQGLDERGHLFQIGDYSFEIPVYHFTEEDKERVRLGYVCLKCLQPHQHPFPDRCSNDGFPMRELQQMLFEKLYVGQIETGPQTSLSDEWEMAKEEVARQRHYPGTSIVVPRGF